jgi:DNA mismatch repair protein MutL
MPEFSSSRGIHVLREEVSRKIAAGEVIDRPLAVVRELLDNALDAGALNVEVYLEGGGLGRIRVVDDGRGMSRHDLELAAQRHATSKIEHEDDLARVATLGFRGEALASIAACARLTLTSRPAGPVSRPAGPVGLEAGAASGSQDTAAASAWRLVVEGGRRLVLEPATGSAGTTVDVADLFFNLPARKRFLKSVAAETQGCRQAFLEKALPHPAVGFRLFVDGKMQLFLPAQGPRERVAAAVGLELQHLHLAEGKTTGAGALAVAGRPELARRDRRFLHLYVNRRRITDFSLLQAADYAFAQYVPGGSHPVAFLFLEVDPALVDFNIHPAKKEARFRNLAELRQLVISTLRGLLADFGLRAGAGAPAPGGAKPAGSAQAAGLAWTFQAGAGPLPGALAPGGAAPAAPGLPGAPPGTAPMEGGPAAAAEGLSVHYLGQLFRLFLLVERGDSLFIVDQHAAHERLLYEELKARRLDSHSQELLLPVRLEGVGEEQVRRGSEAWARLGVRVERGEDGVYSLTALPEELLCVEEELAEALREGTLSVEELQDRVFSLAACRTAVKDGQELDPQTAAELARRALGLPNARCPHGRPIWMRIPRGDILRAVARPPES